MAKLIKKLPAHEAVTDKVRACVSIGYHSARLLELDDGKHYIAQYTYPTSANSLDDMFFKISAEEWDQIVEQFNYETSEFSIDDARTAQSLINIFGKRGLAPTSTQY